MAILVSTVVQNDFHSVGYFENFVLDIKLYMTLHKHKRLGLAQVYSLETDKTKQNFAVLSEVDKEVSFFMILFLTEFNLTLPKTYLVPWSVIILV